MLPARAGSEQAGVGPALEALALGIGELRGVLGTGTPTCFGQATGMSGLPRLPQATPSRALDLTLASRPAQQAARSTRRESTRGPSASFRIP
jgi:hypothetical protein